MQVCSSERQFVFMASSLKWWEKPQDSSIKCTLDPKRVFKSPAITPCVPDSRWAGIEEKGLIVHTAKHHARHARTK